MGRQQNASSEAPRGVISGLALRRIRTGLGNTQHGLAEALGIDVTTVQGWETARRPLPHVRADKFARLRFQLQVLGATRRDLTALDQALGADWLLSEAVAGESTGPNPLAHHVITREATQMLLWPLTGQAPVLLGGERTRAPLGAGQRAHVFGALRVAAERSLAAPPHPKGPLLRRNAYYLLAQDDSSRDWLRAAAAEERRRMPRLDRWTPEWVLNRSLAVAWAMAGDPAPLHEFLTVGLRSDDTLAASLNYWAAWSGEDTSTYCSDEFMVGDLGPWRGDVLLRSLTASLDPATPHLELCVRALWALLRRRPYLVDDRAPAAAVTARVRDLLDRPLDLAATTRRELEETDIIVATRRRA